MNSELEMLTQSFENAAEEAASNADAVVSQIPEWGTALSDKVSDISDRLASLSEKVFSDDDDPSITLGGVALVAGAVAVTAVAGYALIDKVVVPKVVKPWWSKRNTPKNVVADVDPEVSENPASEK